MNESMLYVVGLDVGQSQEHTALALLEWKFVPPSRYGHRLALPHYQIRDLKRWPLGTPYRQIAGFLGTFASALPSSDYKPMVVVDETGVGRPVVELVIEDLVRRQIDGVYCTVTVTAGHEVIHAGKAHWHVPKRLLVSVLQVLLQSRRLHVSKQLENARLLVQELQTFKAKIPISDNSSLEDWREHPHDDLVFATALACWWAERQWIALRREVEKKPHLEQIILV